MLYRNEERDARDREGFYDLGYTLCRQKVNYDISYNHLVHPQDVEAPIECQACGAAFKSICCACGHFACEHNPVCESIGRCPCAQFLEHSS